MGSCWCATRVGSRRGKNKIKGERQATKLFRPDFFSRLRSVLSFNSLKKKDQIFFSFSVPLPTYARLGRLMKIFPSFDVYKNGDLSPSPVSTKIGPLCVVLRVKFVRRNDDAARTLQHSQNLLSSPLPPFRNVSFICLLHLSTLGNKQLSQLVLLGSSSSSSSRDQVNRGWNIVVKDDPTTTHTQGPPSHSHKWCHRAFRTSQTKDNELLRTCVRKMNVFREPAIRIE